MRYCRSLARDLLAAAAENVDRYPVAVGVPASPVPASWQANCPEEIRVEPGEFQVPEAKT
jgi:hypothetical protein